MRRLTKLLILLGLVAVGVTLILLEPTDRTRLFAWGEALAERPATAVIIVGIQCLLFMAALPGTAVIWLVAPFYSPLPATIILTIGTVSGGLGAYALATKLKDSARIWLTDRRAFRILAKHGDFFTQCAMRLFPGFPYSVINYGAGVLRLPIWPFTLACAIGSAIKWGVYSAAIHGVVEADELEEVLSPATLLPLMILALFLIVGAWTARRFTNEDALS